MISYCGCLFKIYLKYFHLFISKCWMLLLEYLTLHMWLVLYLYWPATGLDDSNESALAFIIEPALQIHHSLLSGSHSCSPVHFPSKTCTFPPLRFSPILRSLFCFPPRHWEMSFNFLGLYSNFEMEYYRERQVGTFTRFLLIQVLCLVLCFAIILDFTYC